MQQLHNRVSARPDKLKGVLSVFMCSGTAEKEGMNSVPVIHSALLTQQRRQLPNSTVGVVVLHAKTGCGMWRWENQQSGLCMPTTGCGMCRQEPAIEKTQQLNKPMGCLTNHQ